jgi:CSLREA domain-containing protein
MKPLPLLRLLLFFLCGLALLEFSDVSAMPARRSSQVPTHRAPTTTFLVNSTLDEVDKKPGDGICKSKPSKKCTLRAAIMEANALAGKDKIVLPAGVYPLTRVGSGEDQSATGDLDSQSKIILKGQNAATTIIDGESLDRVLHIVKGTMKISQLTLINGSTASGGGGGIYVANGAKLTLTQVVVRVNRAKQGGGILNEGTLQLNQSTLSENESETRAGGLYNQGTATVKNSTISNNTTLGGGGGGIFNEYDETLTLVNSTVSGNIASGNGGGILTDWEANTYLFNVTIANNRAGAYVHGGGITAIGYTHLWNTILDGNKVSTDTFPYFDFSDCEGNIQSFDYNLVSKDCGFVHQSFDLVDTSAELSPLANNGGPTQTHALQPNSPAIDHIAPSLCVDEKNTVLNTDQRGFSRPVDGDGNGSVRCDIGAFEYHP